MDKSPHWLTPKLRAATPNVNSDPQIGQPASQPKHDKENSSEIASQGAIKRDQYGPKPQVATGFSTVWGWRAEALAQGKENLHVLGVTPTSLYMLI